MRQKPELFFTDPTAGERGDLENFLDKVFSRYSLERAGINISKSCLWYMADKEWLNIRRDLGFQTIPGSREKCLWYEVNEGADVQNLAEALKMYDAEARLLGLG